MMKISKVNVTRLVLLPIASLVISPFGLQAEDEKSFEKEELQHIVSEAKEMAAEFANKIRDWRSGQKGPTAYIGIVVEPVPDVLRDYVDLPKGVGLLLPRIAKDGPADKAGLMDNDILVQFDGQWVINYNQLSTLIEMKGIGATAPLKVLRKGEELELEVTIEERSHEGKIMIIPGVPNAPTPPNVPGAPPPPEELGALMEQIDEWIPGSVRVFIDENQQVHVDLQDLKDDLGGLRTKLAKIKALHADVPAIVEEHGDFGARTTVVHVSDRNINYSCDEGTVTLNSTEEGKYVIVRDGNDDLLYEGILPDDYRAELPPEAVKLIDRLESVDLQADKENIEIELNVEAAEPVTFLLSGN